MNLNPLAWLSGLTQKRQQPIAGIRTQEPIGCTPTPTMRIEAYGVSPTSSNSNGFKLAAGNFMPQGNGQTVSTGTALAKLEQLKRANPQAAGAIATFAAAVERVSVLQRFDPHKIFDFTPKEAAAMETVLALSTALPATNSSRKPARNLVLSTHQGEITVHTTEPTDLPAVGDQVDQYGQPAADGVYTVDVTGNKLTVKKGRISKIEVPKSPTNSAQGTANAFAEARSAVKASRKEEDDFNAVVARNLAARRSANNQSNK